jgi:formyltetrahydrofolate hydrolase
LTEAVKLTPVAVTASEQDHCLLDLLWPNHRGQVYISVVIGIAHHADLADP